QRSALDVALSSNAYRIAAAAVAGAIVLILIPALLATRVSIVGHRQQTARTAGRPSFWHKTGLDIILVGIAIYLLRNFPKRQEDIKQLGLDTSALQLDPLVFLMPAVF